MALIRQVGTEDIPALSEICVKTGAAGKDATGVLDDDDLWGCVYAVPYAVRDPSMCFVVETDDGRAAGYVVGTHDTEDFESWFATDWWPRYARRWPRPAKAEPGSTLSPQDNLLAYAYGRGPGQEPLAGAYPAHLHIDLLPEMQGHGWGRRLIDTFVDALRARGVQGVHLRVDPRNEGAVAFYSRVGFTLIPQPDGGVAFGRHV